MTEIAPLGWPRLHLREVDSTNTRARALAAAGAPNGTLVTAAVQTAGRGRQGRRWSAPFGQALLLSLVLRDPPDLLPLRAGLAVAELAGPDARVKWPNDVLVDGCKVAGVLVESRPQDGWAVVGIGVNFAVHLEDLPIELQPTAGTLDRTPAELEPALTDLLAALARRLTEPADTTLTDLRDRDALLDRPVSWSGGEGIASGIAADGGLEVRRPDGEVAVLDAGEVHVVGTP